MSEQLCESCGQPWPCRCAGDVMGRNHRTRVERHAELRASRWQAGWRRRDDERWLHPDGRARRAEEMAPELGRPSGLLWDMSRRCED